MNNTLFFLHIPKTAGTTLRDILHRQYVQKNIFIIDYSNWPLKALQELESMSIADRKKINLVMGHMEYGWHKYLPENTFTYLTMLREPVDRIISHYYYEKIKGRPFYDLAHQYSLADYLKYSEVKEIDNGMVRFLSGKLGQPFGECDIEMLNLAKANISKDNFVLGLSEHFNESLLLYQKQLRWKGTPFYVKKNTNANRVYKIDDTTMSVIYETNKYDIELYAFAKQIFHQNFRHVHARKRKLLSIRIMNTLAGFVFPIYRKYKLLAKRP